MHVFLQMFGQLLAAILVLESCNLSKIGGYETQKSIICGRDYLFWYKMFMVLESGGKLPKKGRALHTDSAYSAILVRIE